MGAVSPIGNDLETIWKNLMEGYCGIDFIKSFDTTDLPVKIAAELKDFNPEALGVDKGFVKRNDRFAVYTLAAAYQAMKDNEDMQMTPDRLGVYVGSGIGGFDTIMKGIKTFYDEGARWISPLMSPTMIGNQASGSVAQAVTIGTQGPWAL